MPLRDLVDRLRSPDPAARSSAIRGLQRLGGGEAAGALVLVLADENLDVRRLAAEALAALGPSAVEPVLSFLRNWEGDLDKNVIALLGQLGAEPEGQLAIGQRPLARAPAERASIRARALELLPLQLTSRDPEVRSATATALGDIGTSDAIPPLVELLRDLVAQVRIAAAKSLGRLRDEAAVDALLDEMTDDDHEARIAAAEALGHIGSRKAADALSLAVSEDPNLDARRVAEKALRNISNRTVEPLLSLLAGEALTDRIRAMTSLLAEGRAAVLPLLELLTHDDPTVRSAVAEVLGVIGDPTSIDGLGRCRRDPNAQVRFAVATALGRISHDRSAEALAPMLEDDDPKVAAAVASSLEHLGEHAIDPLIEVLSSERTETRVRAIDVLGRLRHRGVYKRLVQGLVDPTPWVRIVSSQALGAIGENRSVPPLIKVLKDRDPIVRAVAVEALGKLRDYRATMPLLEALKDKSDLVKTGALVALGRIGNPVVLPFLTAALDSPEPGIRVAAIQGLAAIRAQRIIPRLRRIALPWPLSREPREVKKAANRALDVLESIPSEQVSH